MYPVLFHDTSFPIYTYPLFLGLAWSQATSYLYQYKKGQKKDFFLFLFLVFAAVWIGGKVLFILSLPEIFESMTDQFNFWSGGGFVFYGGFIGGGLTTLGWLYFKELPFNGKHLITALCLGHGIGRIGCFITGCCFGAPLRHGGHVPTQLIEACFLLFLFFYFKKKKEGSFKTHLFEYLICYSSFRFLIEFFRGDLVRGRWGFFTPSQWISIVLFSLAGLLFLFIKNENKD